MKRRLKKARIKFLSLCPRGANKLPTILKEDGGFEVSLLSKGMNDNGELNAIVYAPEFRDSQGDIASIDVIKDMAYAAARDGVEIDIRHDNKAVGRERAFVAEHFIVQKGDPRFHGLTDYNGTPVDAEGSWAVVVKIDDPDLQKLYREEGWQGISMAGTAEIEHEKEDTTVERVLDALAKRLHKNPEDDMALNEETLAAITAAVSKALEDKQPEPKTEPKQEAATAPVFKGDPTNPEDVQKHLVALKRHKLETEVDWSDPEAVAKHAEAIAQVEKKTEGPEDERVKALEAQVAKAQAQLKQLRGRSNQGGSVSSTTTTQTETMRVEGLEKDDDLQACLAAGAAMAKFANRDRGF